MAINQSINKALNQVDFKSRHSGNGSGSGGGSSTRSNVTCHKRVKNFHIHKYYRSKETVSSRNPPNKSKNELLERVTKKPVVSDTRYIETFTMTRNNNKYKWCTSCNSNNGAGGFHWKDRRDEWKRFKARNHIFVLPIPIPMQ